jgi:hypothetical protein
LSFAAVVPAAVVPDAVGSPALTPARSPVAKDKSMKVPSMGIDAAVATMRLVRGCQQLYHDDSCVKSPVSHLVVPLPEPSVCSFGA